MSVTVAYRWPVRVLVATMLTPGRGMLPAFTVPCTRPPATVADGLLGFTAGAATGGACAPADVTREPLNRQKSREMRRIKMNFLWLPTQLRLSSFQDKFSFFQPAGLGSTDENKSGINL